MARSAQDACGLLTGERTVPGLAEENYWFRRHEAAYAFARDVVTGRVVLEVGCGEGYGAALLAGDAQRVIGLDYDAATVAHAAARYPQAAFVQANLAALPMRSAAVDTVASLQVIEHVWDVPQFLGECLRVLRRDGTLLLTTPNRLTFSPGRDTPLNPFHAHEYVADELAGQMTACGASVTHILGLHAGPRLQALDARHGSFAAAQLAVPPGKWSRRLMRDVVSVRAADFTVTGDRLDACLDLVVLARRR